MTMQRAGTDAWVVRTTPAIFSEARARPQAGPPSIDVVGGRATVRSAGRAADTDPAAESRPVL
jgi:hypothetical protein